MPPVAIKYSDWTRENVWRGLVVLSFFCAMIFVGFWGQSPAGTPILPNQVAKLRVISEMDFSYESPSLTKVKREDVMRRLAHIYKVDSSQEESFLKEINRLLAGVEKLELQTEGEGKAQKNEQIDAFISTFVEDSPYSFHESDLKLLLSSLSFEEVKSALKEGRILVERILQEGIFEGEKEVVSAEDGLSLVLIQRDGDQEPSRESTLSLQEAYRNLRLNVSVMELPQEAWRALFRLLSKGLQPNIIYDELRNDQYMEEMLSKVESVVVKVKQGDTIIFPNEIVTDAEFEKLQFYRKELSERSSGFLGFDLLFLSRVIATLAIAIGAMLYIKLVLPSFWLQSRYLGLMALSLLFNIVIVRVVLTLGGTQFFGTEVTWIAILPYIAPTAISAIIVTLMLQSSAGLLVGALMSLFFTMMMGNSIETLFSSFFASVVGIYFSQNLRVRGKVVSAGALSGVALAASALFVGVFESYPSEIVLAQMLAAVVSGFLTGVLVIGVIPILENLFKIVTDISLLELSDFNHPLLRRMQVEAPGTWHHTLMVANLSESVALEIGANPLICRCASLFHDVGKMVKPEYFIENQKSGENPHLSQNPSISALIIKAHIKEGIELAKQHKLPQIVQDVIRQHHGTSLISYFYHKAKEQKSQQELLPFMQRDEVIDESNYRYDGPRPRFKESAIISLVDSCEAASRSLKKVNQQNVEDLVGKIFQDRIQDYQLAEAPLTLQDLEKIRQHIIFSLLNMLHARIEYPKSQDEIVKDLSMKIQSTDAAETAQRKETHQAI